jgi:uncharacterized protein YbjT (DUF2867 family)
VGLSGRDLLLAGATGLVGGLLLRRLLATPGFDGQVYAQERRELGISDPRLVPLRTAQLAYDHGARHAVLVSSVGASRQSGNFYLRIKGEVEDAVEKIGFTRLDLIQPGLLLGERSERRPAERLMQALAPAGNLLMQGGLKRYRSIPAEEVAAAMVGLLMQDAPGVFSHRYASLRALAAALPPASR